MAAQRWELKQHWVSLALELKKEPLAEGVNMLSAWSKHDETSEAAWKEAEELADQGWELVAVLPRLQAYVSIADRELASIDSTTYSCERGYLMFFKRPIG